MSFRIAVPSDLRGAVDAAAADWRANHKVERFWQKDPSLWTQDGEEKWMGWIDIVERQQKDLATFAELGRRRGERGLPIGFAAGYGRLEPVP